MKRSIQIFASLLCLIASGTATRARQTGPVATDQASVRTTTVASPSGSALTREQVEVHFDRAVALVKSGAVNEAKKLFSALILINPDLVEAYLNLAFLLSAEGDFEHSADALETALSAHPVCRAVTELEFVDELFERPTCIATSPLAERDHGEIGDLLDALENWRQAWQEKRADDYLHTYSARFEPPLELDRNDWEKQRRSRLTAAGAIRVKVSIQRIEITSATTASIGFRQVYESKTFSDSVDKELRFDKTDGEWSIVAELSKPLAEPTP